MKHRITKIVSMFLAVFFALSSLTVVFAQDDEEVLNILYWQAVSTMNPFLSTGTKDIEAASLVLEPLALIGPEGELVPRIAAEIPTLENGLFAEDFMSITWPIKEDIVWSDGTPVTAADVIFTWQYCTSPETGCGSLSFFDGVSNVEAVDDKTVLVTFDTPKPYPYDAFVTAQGVILQQAQFADCIGAAAASCTDQNFAPIGTGPFMVDSFIPNDVVEFVRNPNYRVEGQPFFDRVVFKGGGSAEDAARSVLQTGEFDYAWNLQIPPEVLASMESAGMGQVVVAFSSSLERIIVNQTNPDPSLGDDLRSVDTGENPHPFLDYREHGVVLDAMSMAIDRNIIVDALYGAGGLPACNVVNGPPNVASPNNDDCLVQDIEGANAMLDEAGYLDTDGDGVRETPDGIPLSVLYQTSTNQVRQDTQALVKSWWEEIGIETELRNISASVYFGGDPASPDTFQKFYADVQMFTSGSSSPDVAQFLNRWLCGTSPTPDNNWLGSNVPRYCNPEFDALFDQYSGTPVGPERDALAIQLNDILVEDGTLIPVVFRGGVSAVSNTIGGQIMNDFDTELWNVHEWVRVE